MILWAFSKHTMTPFGNDSVKINVEQIFKLLSSHTEVKAI